MALMRLLGLAMAISLTAASAARAQPHDDDARAHFKRATELYDANDLRGALLEFQHAYELSPSYKVLFNIGQVEMELLEYAQALQAYTRYLRDGGSDVPTARIAAVREDIDRLSGRVGHITIQAAAGAELRLDGVAIGFAPLPDAVPVNVGVHELTVHVPGRDPARRTVEVTARQRLTVTIGDKAVAADRAAPSIPQASTTRASKIPVIVAWSGASALALGCGIAAAVTYSDARGLDRLRNRYPVTKPQLDAQLSNQRTAAVVADALGIAAVVTGGLGLYLTLWRSETSPRAERAVELRLAPAGASLAGRF